MTNKMPISQFVKELYATYARKDGYIMGATGQNPKKWAENSWWFTQYSGTQKTKALYWREHAQRVWDCNGLAEGLYKDYSGVDINTKARYNYSQWCDPKGTGMIPAVYRVAGAAVFWGDAGKPSTIHHVAYLYKPVIANQPAGDWYLIEARGVMYGVVMTKLNSRKPNFWGWMTKYFEYNNSAASAPVDTPAINDALATTARILKKGSKGDDVKEMQKGLIRLGYDCGKWGADGDFGNDTEKAVKVFQKAQGLVVDGEYGPKSRAAMESALVKLESGCDGDSCPITPQKLVEIVNGNCYVRNAPGTNGSKILGTVCKGDTLVWQGLTADVDGRDWYLVEYKNQNAWVSSKYSRLME